MTRNTDDATSGTDASDRPAPDRPADRAATDGGTRTTAADVRSTRRDVLRAAGAGAGVLATGLSATGAAAQEDDRQIPTPWLEVDGNQILDPLGEPVQLRGLNMADPKRIDVTAPARGKTATQVVDYLTDPSEGFYPRIIRIPVQPIDIGEHEPGATGGPPQPPAFSQSELETYLEEHLDPVVQRCRERGVYCIVDFHRHWHASEGSYDAADTNYWAHPDTLEPNEDLHEEVNSFWETVAPRYAEDSHVLYEVYNEPTQPGMWTSLDNDSDIWQAWKEQAQPWVDTIREHAPNNLILIGSPSWTQSPEGYYVEPFDGENLAYTYHIYPNHNASAQQDWDAEPKNSNGEGLGGVHEEVPVVVTEFGWQNDIRDDILAGTTEGFGEPFMEFLEEHDGLHWTAWCADPTWRPVMFNRPFAPVDHTDEEDSIGNPYDEDVPEYCDELPCDWSLLGRDEGDYDTFSGEFIRETLEDLKDDRVPTVEFDDQPPGTPDPSVGEVTQTTMELEWDEVANPGDSPFSHYNVYLDGDLRTTVTDGTSATLTELLGGTTFEVGVSAEDATGNESAPATLTVETEAFDDDAAPPVPDGLEATATTHTSIEIEWDAVEDDGPAGMHHYAVHVDGVIDQTVPVGTTSASLTGLTPDTTYEIAVSAVDYAQNASDPSTPIDVTTEVDRPRPSDLVIDDFDGDTGDSENDLGNWVGGDGFDEREITDDGRLRLVYDDAGWYGTAVARDVSGYEQLMVRIEGASGGEHEDIDLAFAHAEGMLSDVAEGEIEQRASLVTLDLTEASDDDLLDPGQLRFGFDNGGSSTVEIDAIWLRDPDDLGGGLESPASPGDLWTDDVTDTTVEVAWTAVEAAERYTITLDGVERTTTGQASATITGLDPETEYTVGVRAENAAGSSDLETLSVETEPGDGQGGPCEDLETIEVDGDTICNVDGDDYFRDVNGDGTVGNRDVGAFFENFHLDAFDRDEFDYSGNGRVSHGDVVALFDYVI